MNNVGDIVDLSIWPYGNAKESQNSDGTWTFTCQHGTNECIGNMYEACAIEHYPAIGAGGIPAYLGFFGCLEKSGAAGNLKTAQNCAASNGIDWSVIDACAGSNPAVGSPTDGNPLMHSIAVATNSLQPPHQFTPWVVLDGKPLTSAQISLSLTRLVCNAYTGTPPPGCSNFEKTKHEICLN